MYNFISTQHFLLIFMTLSFLSLNTGGCSSPVKNASIYKYVENIAFMPEIVFLQETNNLSKNSTCWNLWSSYDVICTPGHTQGSGVTTLLKKKSSFIIDSSVICDGHILYTEMKFNNIIYHLYNVLIPHDDRFALEAINLLSSHLASCKEGTLIIGGDFNCTLNPHLDRFCMLHEHRPRIVKALKQVIHQAQLCDVWRRMNPTCKKFSWQRNNPNSTHRVSKARLDRFYLPFSLVPSIFSCSITPCSLSDHSAISVQIKLPSSKQKGGAYWHFNNALLDDKHYISIITHFWNDWQKEKGNFPDLLSWWDFGKSHIQSLTKMYGSKLAHEKRESLLNMNKIIDELHSAPDFTPEIQQALAKQRDEMNVLIKNQAKGALVRSRVQYISEMDTSSHFFYNLEKSNFTSKKMCGIRLPSGVITEDESDIKAHVRNFYKELYSSLSIDEKSCDSILQNLNKLDHNTSNNLDNEITIQELTLAVEQLGSNKAPGLDGLSSEFYKTFWPLFKHDFLSVLKFAITSGTLPCSFSKAIITLIPKAGDLMDITNWRPVSLLNSDYKIFAKVLANRLKLCIGDLPFLATVHHSP